METWRELCDDVAMSKQWPPLPESEAASVRRWPYVMLGIALVAGAAAVALYGGFLRNDGATISNQARITDQVSAGARQGASDPGEILDAAVANLPARDPDSPEPAPESTPTPTPDPEPTSEPESMGLRIDGIGAFDFGASERETVAWATAQFGEPEWSGEYECVDTLSGEEFGPARFVSWGSLAEFEQFGLTFNDDGLISWIYAGGPVQLTTADGLGLGATRDVLERLHPDVEITEHESHAANGVRFPLSDHAWIDEGPDGQLSGWLLDGAVRMLRSGARC